MAEESKTAWVAAILMGVGRGCRTGDPGQVRPLGFCVSVNFFGAHGLHYRANTSMVKTFDYITLKLSQMLEF